MKYVRNLITYFKLALNFRYPLTQGAFFQDSHMCKATILTSLTHPLHLSFSVILQILIEPYIQYFCLTDITIYKFRLF